MAEPSSPKTLIDPREPASLTQAERERYAKTRDRLITLGWKWVRYLPEAPPEPDSRYVLVRTPGNEANLFYGNRAGQQVNLHHHDDPLEKSNQWWAPQLEEEADRYLFYGLGLGYPIPLLLEKADAGVKILAVEADPTIFSYCLALRDASRFLTHPNVTVLFTPDSDEAAEATREWLTEVHARDNRMKVLVDPMSMWPNPLFVAEWLDRTAKRIPSLCGYFAKRLREIYPFPSNLKQNWSTLQQRPGIRRLFGKFKDCPILVAGAGPGLDDQLPLIREVQDKVLVVAADTAVRSLLSAGVRVDLALALDSTPKSLDHFRDLPSEDFCPVFGAGLHPPLLEAFKDRAWLSGYAPFPTADLLDALPRPSHLFMKKGILNFNGTVGSAALDLAYRLGGSPLFVAGVDLAYCDGKDHVGGTIYDADTEFQTRQPGVFSVPSVDGGEVPTCTPFLTSLYGIAYQISLMDTEIYNLSAHGAVLVGARGREEGIARLNELEATSTESPRARLIAEIENVERSLGRPLWREEPRKGEFPIDGRGRARGGLEVPARLEIARANIAALRDQDGPLADRLKSRLGVLETGVLENGEVCDWSVSEEAYPRLVVRNPGGETICVAPSLPSPWKEVAQWGAGADSRNGALHVVLGAGLGLHLKAIQREMTEGQVWVWEPYLDRFVASLGSADFRGLFEDERFRWSVGTIPHHLFLRIRGENGKGLARQPVTWRPWIVPPFGVWAADSEKEFVERWFGMFHAIHPAAIPLKEDVAVGGEDLIGYREKKG